MINTNLAERYLTTGQAALVLHVNRLTVQRWVNSGKLTGERVGRITLIPRAEIERLSQEREAEF